MQTTSGFPARSLRVWNSAMELTETLYRASDTLPRNEEYGLKSQLRRAVVSVPTNIAEGQARSGTRAYAAFVDIALGSLREVQTLLDLCLRLERGEPAALNRCTSMSGDVAGQLVKLLQALRKPRL